jgi:hypothetical protein
MAGRTVQTLGDQISAHLKEIDWKTSPPELWDLVQALLIFPNLVDFRERIFEAIPTAFTHFPDCGFVPACVSVVNLIDSLCENDGVRKVCYDNGIHTVFLHHFNETTDDDSAQACLRLFTKFADTMQDWSPLYPSFVAEIAQNDPEMLDAVIPVALQACLNCSEPQNWFAFAVQAAGIVDDSEIDPDFSVTVFYTVCISICYRHSGFFSANLIPADVALPHLCAVLNSDISETYVEYLLDLFLRYASGPDEDPEVVCYFVDAVADLGELDLKRCATAGSDNARCLIETARQLQCFALI